MTTSTYRSVEDIDERLLDIDAELANITDQAEGRKFTEAERTSWNKLNSEVEELYELRTEKVTVKNRLRWAAAKGHTERGVPPEVLDPLGKGDNSSTGRTEPLNPSSSSDRLYDGVPSLVPSEDELRQLHAAVRTGSNARVEMRAVVLSTGTGASDLATQAPVKNRMERRIAVAAGLQTQNVRGIESVPFPVFGSDTAEVAAEGAAKAEFDSITPGSATPQMISIWTDTTRQNILTMTNFEAKLRNVHRTRVALREDELLLTVVTATTGILNPVGVLSADLVLEAAAQIAAGDVGAEPNLVAVNPTDVPTLVGTSVGTGGSASPPFAGFLPTMHGLIVYPTNSVVAGEAVLGAWPQASHFVSGLAPTVLVDSMSGIKTNTLTILTEEAVTLAVDEPGGFAHITAA